jgi:hypothetical protein
MLGNNYKHTLKVSVSPVPKNNTTASKSVNSRGSSSQIHQDPCGLNKKTDVLEDNKGLGFTQQQTKTAFVKRPSKDFFNPLPFSCCKPVV